MAVSGHNVSRFHGSVSKGSAEDLDRHCEPCLAVGQYIQVDGYCVDCREYLCRSCFAYPRRPKASKHHQLLDKDDMDKPSIQCTDLTVCTEMCLIHKNEIKFFCTDHEVLGCTDCMTLTHTTCKIDYIPDKCADIGDGNEYRGIMRELDQKMKDIDVLIKKATLQDEEIDSSHDQVLTEIVKFHTELNDRLDLLQNQIQADSEKKKFKDKQIVKKVLETCTAVSSDMEKFKSSLQDSKSSQQDGQLYILIRRAKAKLKLDDVKNAEESLEETIIQYTFERNKELTNLLTKQDIFGKLGQPTTLLKKRNLSPSTTLVTPRMHEVFDKLRNRGDINVRTKSEQEKCRITGCEVLSSNSIVLADIKHLKLKVVDTERKVVIKEKTLDSAPWDVAVLHQDQIAVTIPSQQKILVLTTAGKLSIIRMIPVKGECKGVSYHNSQLYVVCWNPCSVFTVDTQGNVNKLFNLDNEIFAIPNYILLSEDAEHMYISDYISNGVVRITLQGDIIAIYQHTDLQGPVGMVMLDDGSLLVCCYLNDTIHHISGDLKQCWSVFAGSHRPQSVCYDHQEQEVYICGNSDKLRIMK